MTGRPTQYDDYPEIDGYSWDEGHHESSVTSSTCFYMFGFEQKHLHQQQYQKGDILTYTGAQLLVDYVYFALAQTLKPCDPQPRKILMIIQSCFRLCQQHREKRVQN